MLTVQGFRIFIMPFEGKNVLTVGCQGYAKEKHLSSPKGYTKHGKGANGSARYRGWGLWGGCPRPSYLLSLNLGLAYSLFPRVS
jgi:hypothetical protein